MNMKAGAGSSTFAHNPASRDAIRVWQKLPKTNNALGPSLSLRYAPPTAPGK